ncbi:MAG: hypothetical protein IPP27_18840 [Bacteroidetes bacterium]|nr:hypothetical protein [Bacteroidota bacterium]
MILIARARRSESRMDDQLVPFAKKQLRSLLPELVFYCRRNYFNLDVVSLITGLGIGGLALHLQQRNSGEPDRFIFYFS